MQFPYVYSREVTGVGLEEIRGAIAWEQRSVTVYGKVHPQPRLTKWYARVPYAYSGIVWEPAPMPDLVERLRLEVVELTGEDYDSVLCNLYRDGSDCVGWHRDDEALFGSGTPVASLSFGATRTFKLRRVADHKDQHELRLEHGSCCFMPRGVQQVWEHSIPRTKKPCGVRVNLTFRKVL